MEKLNSEDLKKIQLEILDYVADFCNKNNIKYWLESGTLIGAVRHKGYIPWDDDIDLGMLREDFDKFMNTFNNQKSKYVFKTYENDKTFYYPFGKVLDTSTVLYEPDEKSGYKLSVNIDVFVFDNAPNDEKIIEEMFKKRNKYRKLSGHQTIDYAKLESNVIKRIVKKCLHIILNIFPKGYFINKEILNAKKFSKEDTNKVGNFVGFYRFTGDKKLFEKTCKLEFEGKKYDAPIGYHEWLTAQYGDYMKLPPEEKRITHHSFVAYKIDDLK